MSDHNTTSMTTDLETELLGFNFYNNKKMFRLLEV